jgi:hypothetical protein
MQTATDTPGLEQPAISDTPATSHTPAISDTPASPYTEMGTEPGYAMPVFEYRVPVVSTGFSNIFSFFFWATQVQNFSGPQSEQG